ncbi:MAG: hypothetical protein ACRDRK_03425, partial [Pseudonocardia sp.]
AGCGFRGDVVTAGVRGPAYFGRSHPVVVPARRRCLRLHPQLSRNGVVACVECFEHAVRADERVVVLFDLPAEIEPDPEFVDEIAVERAVAGDRPALTRAELAVAAAALAGRGWSRDRISRWLGIASRRLQDGPRSGPAATAPVSGVSGVAA